MVSLSKGTTFQSSLVFCIWLGSPCTYSPPFQVPYCVLFIQVKERIIKFMGFLKRPRYPPLCYFAAVFVGSINLAE